MNDSCPLPEDILFNYGKNAVYFRLLPLDTPCPRVYNLSVIE